MTTGAARLVVMLLYLATVAPIGLGAQPGPAEPGADAAQPGDLWEFEDEEETETWSALLQDQALDLSLFVAFATLALVSFFRKSAALKYVTLVAAVAYLGFAKSQLISVVNVFSLVTGNLPVFRYSLAWYLFAGFTVVSTVLWGRVYCGRICAYGALTQLLDRIVPARLRLEVPPAARAARRESEVRAARRNTALLPRHVRHRGVPICRAVLAVHSPVHDRSLDRPGRVARRHCLRQEPLLPILMPRRRRARVVVESDGLPDQALVGVQHLQDLREGVRMGCDSRAEDSRDRVRPLRRLRTALPGHGEVSTLDHSPKNGGHVGTGCLTPSRGGERELILCECPGASGH